MSIRAPKLLFALMWLALPAFNARLSTARAQGTAFIYQGQLSDGGNPANGLYDVRVTVFDGLTNGNVVGSPLTNFATALSNGLFAATLDFGGGVFTGPARWLQLDVRTNGAVTFTPLTPREPVLPVPYAMTANSASNLLGTVSAAQLSGTLPAAQLPGSVLTNNQSGAVLTGTFSGSGAGLTNVPGTVGWQNVTGTSQSAQPNSGYLANNASLVTITLPASPNLGDIVRVTGVGAGGWLIAQNPGQSIQSGAFGGSYDYGGLLTNWTQTSAPTTNWQGIAASSDGTKFAAVVAGGGIYTSSNSAQTWTQTAASNENWSAVSASADGTRLAAVVATGGIFTSTDSGVTWSQSSAPVSQWDAIASSADGTRLVAQSDNNIDHALNGVYISTNSGVDWIQTTQTFGSTAGVASSADGTILLDVQYAFGIEVSTNAGAGWFRGTVTPPNSGGGWTGAACSADGTKMAAVQENSPYGFGSIYLSTNSGANWTVSSAPTNVNWISVASSADGSKIAASVDNGGLYLSSDSGATWQPTSAPTNNLEVFQGTQFIASSATGNELAEVIYGGGIWTSRATPQPTTTPGISGYLTGGQYTAIELQYLGNGQWLPLSSVGVISAR